MYTPHLKETGFSMPLHEETALTKYFNDDSGPKKVVDLTLEAPFYRKLPAPVALEVLYRDMRGLLATLKKIAMKPGDPTSFRIRDISEPHYYVWNSNNDFVNALLAAQHLEAQNPNATLLHRAELDKALKPRTHTLSKGGFGLWNPQKSDYDYFGVPAITVVEGGEVTQLVDDYAVFDTRKNFPSRGIEGRAKSLNDTIGHPLAKKAFLKAVGEVLKMRGEGANYKLTDTICTKAILVRSTNRQALAYLRESYSESESAGYEHGRTTAYLTFMKIADDFSPEIGDWKRFYSPLKD